MGFAWRDRDVTLKPRLKPREKAGAKPKPPPKPRRGRRGRRRKDDPPAPPPDPTRLQRQLERDLQANLTDLPTVCDWGCKKNSQSKKECWRGYKLHLDVIDGDIPVSAILTSASLHDSQAAIPLAQMSAGRIVNLYDLADAAYDADARLTFTGRRPGPRQPPTTGRRRWSLPQNSPAPD